MYKTDLLLSEMYRQGVTYKRLAELTGLHHTTVAEVLTTGIGRADSFYLMAAALGLPVKRFKKTGPSGNRVYTYDLTPILVEQK